MANIAVRTIKRAKRPKWYEGRRELFWGNDSIRKFSRQAPAQIAVLSLFQENRWAWSIDVSSIIPAKVKQKKLWIRNTAKNLNRDIDPIKFRPDGANLGMAWGEA